MTSIAPSPAAPPRVLIIDDEAIILRLADRILTKAGFAVATATSAETATTLIESADLVVCDDGLTGMRGSTLLESLRSRGRAVPFILMTGAPTVAGVVGAYEGGVSSYLPKPFCTEDLVNRVRVALEGARAGTLPSAETRSRERAARCRSHRALDDALAGLEIAFQPITYCKTGTLFGYEALMRSREPSLPHPGAVLQAGEDLGRLHEIGRRVRELAAASFEGAPKGALLFLNLHACDLDDEELFDRGSRLASFADRVVLEITERADFRNVQDGPARLARLRANGFRIAVDDLGAGYAGLTSLVELDPDVVKLDMVLVRDIDTEPRKRRVVQALLRLCAELGRQVIAEGVETEAELTVLRELGCELVQGYLIARPGPPFPAIRVVH
jgi:EAL domain-containing protein (putative c-di-GMP-specific phosphodiesterase class I)